MPRQGSTRQATGHSSPRRQDGNGSRRQGSSLILALLLVACSLTLAATARVDVESVAREIKGSFHWYPVQKTFSIVSAKDTLKFAVGIPYMTRNGRTVDLSAAPELDNGHLWIAENDAKKISSKVAAVPVIKDRNGMDLTEAEDIKKRWQEYTEELYKKDLHDPDNHDGMITHLDNEFHIFSSTLYLSPVSLTRNVTLQGLSCPRRQHLCINCL